eukprot:3754563-Ditylum_brightwellii.AAC.1
MARLDSKVKMGWSMYPLHLHDYFYSTPMHSWFCHDHLKRGATRVSTSPPCKGFILYGNGVVIVSLLHLHKRAPNFVVVKEDKEGKLEALPS